MSVLSFRGIILTFLVLGGLWILFLVSAHLILDLEQGRKYFERFRSSQHADDWETVEDAEAKLEFESIEESDTPDVEADLTLCEIPEDKSYPDCKNQVEWLREHWKKDPCYEEYDVDGTDCSIIIYLSEVESWCPRLPWREYIKKKERKTEKAVMRKTPDELISSLKLIPGSQPIISRISGMWSYWQDGLQFMQTKSENMENRKKLEILVFIGYLMDARSNDSKLTDDVLQWSDLLASLYLLGHDVIVKAERVELLSLLTERSQFTHRGCAKGSSGFDLIYIDIPGLQQLVTSAPDAGTRSLIWSKYSCRLRVLAPFGMDAEFNYRDYKGAVMGERSQLGNWNLNLKQFMTKYPLSADNSFLGFALRSRRKRKLYKKTSIAFVYGKPEELTAHKSFLQAVDKHWKIHTAVSTAALGNDLQFINNHENLNSTSFGRLMRKTKIYASVLLLIMRHNIVTVAVDPRGTANESARILTVILFIGLGSPFEEALPLDALAQGCVFINPKFTRHQNRLNSKVLKDQPSSRKLGSQHPYAEMFIGRPWVYTINIKNVTEVKSAMTEIKKQKVRPFVPFEFSCEGMLERLNVYIENQNFCDKDHHWPPHSDDLEIIIGRAGEACTETCFREGFICGSEHFHLLNSSELSTCKKAESEESLVAPAIEESSSRCVYQRQSLLYSCAGYDPEYKRLCPCTLYRKGQIALCKSCL